ncbi:hypothetical protein [Lentibacillus amyloliquefaciens]|uniref:Uncharacterized protein n=1 Tax=Lentibacillus amyloliquefaciens TaxID=1472767 RepID=A0A0U4GCG5_9BACI|nr:hypothetical protein [Lentibacillus amyloliquefaciens]ALX50426.1 hypothetical protein AOX59_18680 [Lentibacillus amyloliquefaciens]
MDDKQLETKMNHLRSSIDKMPSRTDKSAIMQRIDRSKSKRRHPKLWVYIGTLTSLIIISLLFLSSTSGLFLGNDKQMANESAPSNEIVATIRKVLETQFTGPDEELIQLLNAPENMTIIGKGVESSDEEKQTNTELESYLNEKYKDHFTENMYSDFIGKYAMGFQTSAHENGYRLEVADISIDQSENNENIYDFSVTVQYQKDDGEKNEAEVTGNAHMKDGKIGNMEYLDDEGLSQALKSDS